MKDYLYYHILASNDDKSYKLDYSSDYDFPTVSLNIDNRLGKEYFDNPNYIYGDEFYDIIKLWVEESKVNNGEAFTDIVKDIPLEDFETILEILEKGIELGFNLDKINEEI